MTTTTTREGVRASTTPHTLPTAPVTVPGPTVAPSSPGAGVSPAGANALSGDGWHGRPNFEGSQTTRR